MRCFLAVLVLASVSFAETPAERLAGAAKLWVYIKYFHPRVTSTDLDWDAAFASAAPGILEAQSDQEAAAAVQTMLASLNDPATQVLPRGDVKNELEVFDVTMSGEVTVVRSRSASEEEAAKQYPLAERLADAGPVVFDLRGSRRAPLEAPLPVSKDCVGPGYHIRSHSGYASPEMISGGGYYRSTWEASDGVRFRAAAKPIRPVFLINSRTLVPTVILAVQYAGAGAIVSEDEVNDGQVVPPAYVRLWTAQNAAVRLGELHYPDGTTGFTVNRVLNKTGADALADAAKLAESGDWPQAAPRLKAYFPSASFREKTYDSLYPDQGIRYVAAARIWGVFSYFHPYKHLYDRDWDGDVLPEFLQKIGAAKDARAYHLAVAEMVSHTKDTHDFVSSPELRAAMGSAPVGVITMWIEGKPVVTKVAGTAASSGLKPGDVITKIDGTPVQDRIDFLRKYTAHSTEQSARNHAMWMLLSGDDGTTLKLSVTTGDSAEREIQLKRGPVSGLYARDGEIFRLLKPEVGYVDLTRLQNAQVDAMFEMFAKTKAIIMDMRGYPRGTAWSIAPRLAAKQGLVAAQFRRNLVRADEGEDQVSRVYFEQRIPTTSNARYEGKTVLLINEHAMSQSEHSGLFYKTANGTTFIGSPTMGANGDVTYFMAPGKIRIGFSGHDVRWPDGRQLQRVGLQPDIEVRPTISGIREGRDEVLERALLFVQEGR